jgi:hypothetical protein
MTSRAISSFFKRQRGIKSKYKPSTNTRNRNKDKEMRQVSALTAFSLLPWPLAMCFHAVYRLLMIKASKIKVRILNGI